MAPVTDRDQIGEADLMEGRTNAGARTGAHTHELTPVPGTGSSSLSASDRPSRRGRRNLRLETRRGAIMGARRCNRVCTEENVGG